MNGKTAIVLALASVLASGSAALAASPRSNVVHHRGSQIRQEQVNDRDQRLPTSADVHYYEHDDNGTVWSFYPGYRPTTEQ